MDSSLKHVATEAGFSIRTVKRALTDSGYVNPDTKARILDAASRLNYRPNLAARALKTGRSTEMGVVLTSIDELHMEKLAGFEHRLRQEGYSVHVLFAPAETSEADVPEVTNELLVRRPAGVAIFPGPHALSSGVAALLAEAGVPHVLLDPRQGVSDAVFIDRPRGIQDAVHHLACQGRQRIAYLGPADRSRLDGYEAAIQSLGLTPIIIETHGSAEDRAVTREAVECLLALDPRPQAVQVYSDVVATGVLAALHERAVRVPQDIAVVGFDDRHFAALTWPRLTTVAQPNREVGEAAAEILLRKLRGEPPPEGGWSRTLPTRLIVRDSA
jgi:DNA-binding LacI/PurR family transcriptional regulator